MNKKLPHLLNLISLGIILTAGGGIFLQTPQVIAAGETKQNQNAEKQAIQAVIDEQIKAANAENIQAIQNTYHPNSTEFNEQKAVLQQLFQTSDIKWELVKVEFIKIAGNEATVRIISTSRKIRGNVEYKGNKSTIVTKLQKFQGRWKFFSSEVEKIEFIK